MMYFITLKSNVMATVIVLMLVLRYSGMAARAYYRKHSSGRGKIHRSYDAWNRSRRMRYY